MELVLESTTITCQVCRVEHVSSILYRRYEDGLRRARDLPTEVPYTIKEVRIIDTTPVCHLCVEKAREASPKFPEGILSGLSTSTKKTTQPVKLDDLFNL